MAAPEFGPDIGNLRHLNPGRESFVEQRFVKGEYGLELGFRKGAASALVAQHPRPRRQRQRRQLLIFVEWIEQRVIAVARLAFYLVKRRLPLRPVGRRRGIARAREQDRKSTRLNSSH